VDVVEWSRALDIRLSDWSYGLNGLFLFNASFNKISDIFWLDTGIPVADVTKNILTKFSINK
jgi:hypothetical protein